MHGWRYVDNNSFQALETVMSYIDRADEMLMRDTRYTPDVVPDAVRKILNQFHA